MCTSFLIGAFFYFPLNNLLRERSERQCEGACCFAAQCPNAHPPPAGGGIPPAVAQRRARTRTSAPAARRASGAWCSVSAARGAGATVAAAKRFLNDTCAAQIEQQRAFCLIGVANLTK